jgi:hypothetical protein
MYVCMRVCTDAADLHAGAGQRTEGGLGAGPGGLGAATTRGAQLDVESSDATLLETCGCVRECRVCECV